MTEVNIACIKELSQMVRHVILWHMAPDLGLAYSTVQHIMANVLQYCKVCATWMPRVLTDGNKAGRMMACLLQ
jgi:hypothetical protein